MVDPSLLPVVYQGCPGGTYGVKNSATSGLGVCLSCFQDSLERFVVCPGGSEIRSRPGFWVDSDLSAQQGSSAAVAAIVEQCVPIRDSEDLCLENSTCRIHHTGLSRVNDIYIICAVTGFLLLCLPCRSYLRLVRARNTKDIRLLQVLQWVEQTNCCPSVCPGCSIRHLPI